MSEKIFFGKSEGIKPEETLKEVHDRMEKMDEENQEKGGDGTVILKNEAGESRIILSTEEVPEAKENN